MTFYVVTFIEDSGFHVTRHTTAAKDDAVLELSGPFLHQIAAVLIGDVGIVLDDIGKAFVTSVFVDAFLSLFLGRRTGAVTIQADAIRTWYVDLRSRLGEDAA